MPMFSKSYLVVLAVALTVIVVSNVVLIIATVNK